MNPTYVCRLLFDIQWFFKWSIKFIKTLAMLYFYQKSWKTSLYILYCVEMTKFCKWNCHSACKSEQKKIWRLYIEYDVLQFTTGFNVSIFREKNDQALYLLFYTLFLSLEMWLFVYLAIVGWTIMKMSRT